MLSPPLSVHAKTEISTILVLPGKCSLHGIKNKIKSNASSEPHLSGFLLPYAIVEMRFHGLCSYLFIFLQLHEKTPENCLFVVF